MKHWKHYSFSLALFVVAACPSLAAEKDLKTSPTNAPPTTVAELVMEALDKNPELNFYKAEIAAAKGERRQAGVYPNPEVNGEVGRKRASGGGLSAEGTAWAVSVSQPFEWPGRVGLRKAIANRQVELAEIGYTQFRAALAARVRTLGYGLAAAQEKAQAAQQVAQRGQELVEVLVQRDPAGITPLLEIRIIEATVIAAKRRAAQAVREAQVSLYELNQLRGAPLGEVLAIRRADIKFDRIAPLEDLVAQARTNNYQVRIRQAELGQQGFQLALSRNERWPAVSVGPYYSQEKAGETERTFGVGVSLPVPLWNRNQGNIEANQARQQQAETSLLVTQREIEREVRERAAYYQALLDQMTFWRPDTLQQLREAAELADRHYRLGAVPVATYVELQDKYIEATEAILDSQREAQENLRQIELLIGRALEAETIAEPKAQNKAAKDGQ